MTTITTEPMPAKFRKAEGVCCWRPRRAERGHCEYCASSYCPFLTFWKEQQTDLQIDSLNEPPSESNYFYPCPPSPSPESLRNNSPDERITKETTFDMDEESEPLAITDTPLPMLESLAHTEQMLSQIQQ